MQTVFFYPAKKPDNTCRLNFLTTKASAGTMHLLYLIAFLYSGNRKMALEPE
jgi:hypothetical protein